MADDAFDDVFRALADPTRRHLLDQLRERNGQTLSELCAGLGMARQSASQHLELLESAHLITTVRRGRAKLHYLNPVPLHEIGERWIGNFERPRLRALHNVKRQAEEAMTSRPSFVYVTYIQATAERVWDALTDADLTAQYWGHSNISDWQVGSSWEHRRADGSGVADGRGTVVRSERPFRLVLTWGEWDGAGGESRVSFDIEPYGDIVRLTVTHEDLADETIRDSIAQGWPAVLSNLKSLIETGSVLSSTPWQMPPAQPQT